MKKDSVYGKIDYTTFSSTSRAEGKYPNVATTKEGKGGGSQGVTVTDAYGQVRVDTDVRGFTYEIRVYGYNEWFNRHTYKKDANGGISNIVHKGDNDYSSNRTDYTKTNGTGWSYNRTMPYSYKSTSYIGQISYSTRLYSNRAEVDAYFKVTYTPRSITTTVASSRGKAWVQTTREVTPVNNFTSFITTAEHTETFWNDNQTSTRSFLTSIRSASSINKVYTQIYETRIAQVGKMGTTSHLQPQHPVSQTKATAGFNAYLETGYQMGNKRNYEIAQNDVRRKIFKEVNIRYYKKSPNYAYVYGKLATGSSSEDGNLKTQDKYTIPSYVYRNKTTDTYYKLLKSTSTYSTTDDFFTFMAPHQYSSGNMLSTTFNYASKSMTRTFWNYEYSSTTRNLRSTFLSYKQATSADGGTYRSSYEVVRGYRDLLYKYDRSSKRSRRETMYTSFEVHDHTRIRYNTIRTYAQNFSVGDGGGSKFIGSSARHYTNKTAVDNYQGTFLTVVDGALVTASGKIENTFTSSTSYYGRSSTSTSIWAVSVDEEGYGWYGVPSGKETVVQTYDAFGDSQKYPLKDITIKGGWAGHDYAYPKNGFHAYTTSARRWDLEAPVYQSNSRSAQVVSTSSKKMWATQRRDRPGISFDPDTRTLASSHEIYARSYRPDVIQYAKRPFYRLFTSDSDVGGIMFASSSLHEWIPASVVGLNTNSNYVLRRATGTTYEAVLSESNTTLTTSSEYSTETYVKDYITSTQITVKQITNSKFNNYPKRPSYISYRTLNSASTATRTIDQQYWYVDYESKERTVTRVLRATPFTTSGTNVMSVREYYITTRINGENTYTYKEETVNPINATRNDLVVTRADTYSTRRPSIGFSHITAEFDVETVYGTVRNFQVPAINTYSAWGVFYSIENSAIIDHNKEKGEQPTTHYDVHVRNPQWYGTYYLGGKIYDEDKKYYTATLRNTNLLDLTVSTAKASKYGEIRWGEMIVPAHGEKTFNGEDRTMVRFIPFYKGDDYQEVCNTQVDDRVNIGERKFPSYSNINFGRGYYNWSLDTLLPHQPYFTDDDNFKLMWLQGMKIGNMVYYTRDDSDDLFVTPEQYIELQKEKLNLDFY